MRGGGKNEDTQHIPSSDQLSQERLCALLSLSLEWVRGRGTQEGRRSSALFSILYLYESEGVV